MIYLVLGMHKSGTTLISQMLHESGVNMGDFNSKLTYDQGNQYEREITKKINKEILNCGDTSSILVNRIPTLEQILPEYYQQAKNIINQLNNNFNTWGFKDPRSCLLSHFWIPLLNPCRIIFIFRDPSAIYKHYTHGLEKQYKIMAFARGWAALRSWYIYNFNVINSYEELTNKENFILVKYENLLENNHFERLRLESFLNQPLKNVINPSLYRHQPQMSFNYKTSVKLCQFFNDKNVIWLYEYIDDLYKKQF